MASSIVIFSVFTFFLILTTPLQCDVEGCDKCTLPNLCGRCKENFLLEFNQESNHFFCKKLYCPFNCKTCFQEHVCEVCQEGFYISELGLCKLQKTSANPLPLDCLWGKTSQSCSLCRYGFYQTMNQCALKFPFINGDKNCLAKQSNLYCQVCRSGFLVGPKGKCVPQISEKKMAKLERKLQTNGNGNFSCAIQNCQTCSPANNCTTCMTGFQLFSVNTCLSCPDPNCQTCKQANICETCNTVNGNQYFPSPTGAVCVQCNKSKLNMQGCLSCNETDSCGQCSNGYQLFNAAGFRVCIKCNIRNCKTCGLSNSAVVCLECSQGYSAKEGSCNQCLFPCVTCNSNQSPNNCQTCQTPSYFVTPLQNGTCLKNFIPNCIGYTTANLSQCSQCSEGFLLNSDNTTCKFNCPQNCQNCKVQTFCITCVEGYLLTSNGQCARCEISGCSECESDFLSCKKCFKGFYALQKECKICPSYCKDCSSATTCNQLAQAKSQVLLKVGETIVLAVCKSTCVTCSNLNPEICLECVSGFYLKDGKCFKCSSTCLTCDLTSSSKCLSCYPNSFLVDDTCKTCNQKCLTCEGETNLDKCTSCRDGFYLTNDGNCEQGCPTNCLSCSNLTTCVKCMSGYTIFTDNSGSRCLQCISLCRSCAQGKPATCLQCGVGFYLADSTCKKCSPNCKQCTAGVCNECVSGFFLTSTFSCAQNCIAPCATCTASDPNKCLSCVGGYTFNDETKVCDPFTDCNGACVICPFGYSLKDGNCLQCSKQNCQSCDAMNSDICYSCTDLFYLNTDGNCSSCDKSCQKCFGPNGCLTCADGYTNYQSLPATADGIKCEPCVSPCKTCRSSPDFCTSCVDGYVFRGWKCAQEFSFNVGLTLTVSMADFYSNYEGFLKDITKALGSEDTNSVTIIDVRQGSIVTEIQAAPVGKPGSDAAKSQLSALSNLVKEGASIGGLSVGSSSLVVQGDSTGSTNTDVNTGENTGTTVSGNTPAGSSSSLGLILGVVIPLGILVLIGITIVVLRLRERSKDQDQSERNDNNMSNYSEDHMAGIRDSQKSDLI